MQSRMHLITLLGNTNRSFPLNVIEIGYKKTKRTRQVEHVKGPVSHLNFHCNNNGITNFILGCVSEQLQ